MTLLEAMKKGIKENETLNAVLQKMIDDGLSEDEALNIMISVWVDKMNGDMMSEKRFTIHKESKYKEEWYAYPFCIKEDGEVVLETIPLSIAEKVRDKLNEQQATIKQLRQSQDVKEFSALFNQSIALQREIKDLKEENEKLRQQLKQKQEEERLYANEILELRKTNEEFMQFKELGGDY